ncbi:hypothetical protein L7Q78_43865, partial [Achromobacter xylosoxidans]|nr:hypothetical protein [Achromobacter xylosoxidans]
MDASLAGRLPDEGPPHCGLRTWMLLRTSFTPGTWRAAAMAFAALSSSSAKAAQLHGAAVGSPQTGAAIAMPVAAAGRGSAQPPQHARHPRDAARAAGGAADQRGAG